MLVGVVPVDHLGVVATFEFFQQLDALLPGLAIAEEPGAQWPLVLVVRFEFGDVAAEEQGAVVVQVNEHAEEARGVAGQPVEFDVLEAGRPVAVDDPPVEVVVEVRADVAAAVAAGRAGAVVGELEFLLVDVDGRVRAVEVAEPTSVIDVEV